MNETQRVYINTLNANDVFTFPGDSFLNVVESRRNFGGKTTITYRPIGDDFGPYMYTRPGLTVVDRVL